MMRPQKVLEDFFNMVKDEFATVAKGLVLMGIAAPVVMPIGMFSEALHPMIKRVLYAIITHKQ